MAIQEVGSARGRLSGLVQRVRRSWVHLRLLVWRARQARLARELRAFEDRQQLTAARIFRRAPAC